MTEQKQIEEMAQIINGSTELDTVAYYRCMNIAKTIYNAGYRKASDGALKLLLEAPYDELRKFCIKYYNEAKDLRQEVVELKVDNEHLTNKLRYILLSIDTVKEMNAMCNIDEHRKQAIKEFAEKVKEKFNGYEATYYNGNEDEFHDLQEEIDELLKEWL